MKTFGAFRLDPVNHCLWRGDERAPLTPKAFDVLRFLVEHADRLVTPDELLEALWPDTYVNPEGIRKYILEIRKVLGDRSDQPEFIETFPKRGYQFVTPVTDDRKVAGLDSSVPLAGNVVGRQEGLARLDRYLQTALSGQRQVVFVTGESGIGKTTLVDLFQQHAVRRSDLRIARGQCIEGFGGMEAYYPMLEAIGSLLRSAEGSSFIQTLAKRAPTWLIQFPGLVKPEQRESLQREILGGTRERMVREFCEALESIGEQTPLIVILEDLHWVDPSTLDLISAFARRREPAKVLLLCTYRPVDVVLSQSPLKALKQDLLVHRLCHEIALERLEESDIADYMTKFLAAGIPSGLANLVHRNSGGNPLFMAAIVQDLTEKGLIAVERGRLILTAPLDENHLGVPETLQQMLEIQLEQLSPEELRILQTGSVAGERFSVWAAAAMLDSSPVSIEETCDRLANRQHFIRSVGMNEAPNGAPSAHYEFRHALYRQALRRSLSSLYRSQLHRSLGERLMPVCKAGRPDLASELALHFEEGRDYEQAARCLMLAAENAANRFSHRDSIHILRRALELVPSLATEVGLELEIQIRQRLGDTHFVLGEMSDSAESYQAAVDLAASAGLITAHVDALVRLGLPAWYLDPARGSEVCRQALEMSGSLEDPLLAARTRLAVANFRLLYDEWREAEVEVRDAALRTIRRLSGSAIVHDPYHCYVLAVQGDCQEARRQADALINSTDNPTVYVLGSGGKSLSLLLLGRFGEMLQILRAGRQSADKNGEEPWMYILGETWLRTLCFDFDGVRRLSGIIMRSDAEQHSLWLRTVSRIASGYAELSQGNHREALQFFSQVRDPRVTPKFFLHWHWRMFAHLGMTEARLQAGHIADAHREVDDLLSSALSLPCPDIRSLAWEAKSRVARANKDFGGARASINNALAILDQFDIPVAAWQVHRTAWDLCADQGDGAGADRHRNRARELIMGIADSFENGEPLRESLLAAPPVRRIIDADLSAFRSSA